MAPVMKESHQNSPIITTAIKLQIAQLMQGYLGSILYWPGILSNVGVPFIHWFPRTTWAIVQGIVGFDSTSHIDYTQLPMMARNDVGGTSIKNLVHWE